MFANPFNSGAFLLAPLLLTASCTHPVIVGGSGAGDVVSASGDRDCLYEQQTCDMVVPFDYQETYTAVPRAGSFFSHWQGCDYGEELASLIHADRDQCILDVPASAVTQNWFKTMPASRAVFNSLLCTDTAPLASTTTAFGGTFELMRGESAVYAAAPSSLRLLELNTLAEQDGYNLFDLTVDGIAATREDDSEAVLVATQSGIARSLRLEASASPGLQAEWTQDTRRAGCIADSIRTAPAMALRRKASPAFQSAHAGDLAIFGTAYQPCGGTAYRTDNRVWALDAPSGVTAWTFNVFGSVDIDAIQGLRIDPARDRVHVTSERTHSSSQDSVWSIDLVHGTLAWSANVGRVQSAPALAEGRLYVASLSGRLHAFDAATGAALWNLDLGVPLEVDPVAVKLTGGEVVLGIVDFLGEIRVLRDDGTSATILAAFQLPTGAPATGAPGPAVAAVSPIEADTTGRALVGADDGRLYPIDLLTGTVGVPIAVDPTASDVTEIVLEPPRLFSSPASVLVGSSAGTLARYCTEVGAAACSNGVDDDGDGLVDFPDDPGCSAADDRDEGQE